MESDINKALLLTYFAGNATVFDKKRIDEWCQDTKNQEFFYEALAQWEVQNAQVSTDVEQAVVRHFERMERASDVALAVGKTPNWAWTRPWSVAASVAVIVVFLGWLNRQKIMYQTYQTAFGQTKTLQLSDSTLVTLNSNSVLKAPRFGFGKNNREVFLSGEAAFTVYHTADNQAFVVKTARQFDVLVLGTEFTVFSRLRGAKVILKSGKIRLRYQEGKARKQLMMKAGDLVVFDQKNSIKQATAPQPRVYMAWKENRFVFDQTPLSEIAYLFAENFGLRLTIADPELAKWTVSGSFAAQNAQELLAILTSSANLTYQKIGNDIIISNHK